MFAACLVPLSSYSTDSACASSPGQILLHCVRWIYVDEIVVIRAGTLAKPSNMCSMTTDTSMGGPN